MGKFIALHVNLLQNEILHPFGAAMRFVSISAKDKLQSESFYKISTGFMKCGKKSYSLSGHQDYIPAYRL